MNIVRTLLDRVESLSIQLGKLQAQLLQANKEKSEVLNKLYMAESYLKDYQNDIDFYKNENAQLRQNISYLTADSLGREVADKFNWSKDKRIPMIKELRDRTKCSLSEAKQVIDKLVPASV